MDLIGTIESAVFSHDVGMKYKDSGCSRSQPLPSSHLWRWCHHLKPCVRSLFVWACWACSSTSVMGKAWDRQAACSTGASLGSTLQRDRAPSLWIPPFHPLLTGQWPLGLCSWSVYSQSQLHLGIVQRVLGIHVLSHLSCLQEWIFLVYKCIYLVTMLLCVWVWYNAKALKCLVKRTYEFIENWI